MGVLCWWGMGVFVVGVLLALASQTITTEGLTGTWSHRLETLVFWVGIVVCVVGILFCLPTLVRLWPQH